MPERPGCDCGCTNVFGDREARNDLKRYLKGGPDASTRALIEAIRAEGVEGASVLDVGGGIGAIQLELLAAGAASTESVDASEAYAEVARAEAARRGFGERTRHRVGTLEQLAGAVDAADVVTLDKVVCCDPDLQGLLGEVTRHARRMVGLVYPRDAWWNGIVAKLLAAWGWVTRDSTRWYLHERGALDRILHDAGFERRDVSTSLVWQVALYVRQPASAP